MYGASIWCIFFCTIDHSYRVCTLSLASRSHLDEKVVGAKELQLGQTKWHRQGTYNGTESKHYGLFWGNILKGVHAEKSNLEVLKRWSHWRMKKLHIPCGKGGKLEVFFTLIATPTVTYRARQTETNSIDVLETKMKTQWSAPTLQLPLK